MHELVLQGLTLRGISRLFSTSANWPVMRVVLTSPCTKNRLLSFR